MRVTKKLLLLSLLVACLPLPGMADPGPPLDDQALQNITAGSAMMDENPLDIMTFDVVRTTRSGRVVTADGSLSLLGANRLILTGGAQNGLSSVININAVNSAVNVLLNLNITVDSRVGAINQTNFNQLPQGWTPTGIAR